MPGTIHDDIEIIDAGHGGGTGTSLPAGTTTADDPGSGCRDSAARLLHGDAVGVGRHRDVLHGADQFVYLVRKGLGDDWQRSRCRACCGSIRWCCSPAASPS